MAAAGALSQRVKEQAYITVHPVYLKSDDAAENALVDGHEIVYSFARGSAPSSMFGFGPGRFGCDFKFWQFALMASGDVGFCRCP